MKKIFYLFTILKNRGTLPTNGVMYNTIVTSPLGGIIANAFGIKHEAFLTGFKFIGSRIDYYEKHGELPTAKQIGKILGVSEQSLSRTYKNFKEKLK